MRVGVLHPGEMGVTVAAAAAAGGHEVMWTPEGRSAATRRRAESAGLLEVASLEKLLRDSEVVFSVCPPHAAAELAYMASRHGYTGLFCDCNAVSPSTAREIADVLDISGADVVDGGIVGPPARSPGTTRLYLSGPACSTVAQILAAGPLETIVVGDECGAASALKAAYAGWTKGSAALLLAVRALARAEGVEDALLTEWNRSQPGLGERSQRAAQGNARKAWRFAGEMREIASALDAAGLPVGFHEAAGDVYDRLQEFKDADPLPSLDDVVEVLLARRADQSSAS